jgi:hypothetical protein
VQRGEQGADQLGGGDVRPGLVFEGVDHNLCKVVDGFRLIQYQISYTQAVTEANLRRWVPPVVIVGLMVATLFESTFLFPLIGTVVMFSALALVKGKRRYPTRLQVSVIFVIGMAIGAFGFYGWAGVVLAAMIGLVAELFEWTPRRKTDHTV